MTDVRRMEFSVTIQASPERVWETAFADPTYRQWTTPFCEGSYFEGSWESGARIHFLAPGGDGMVAEIAESRPYEVLSIRHVGVVRNGVEDTDSDEVRAWAPAYENYRFEVLPEGTRLVVEQEVAASSEESMTELWSEAFAVLKALCEGQGEGAVPSI